MSINVFVWVVSIHFVPYECKTPILKQRVDFFPSDFEFSFSAKSQTTPHDSPGTRFLTPKISAKFDGVTPYGGAKCRWGGSKIGDFRQITGYISKTVKHRHIVSIKVE